MHHTTRLLTLVGLVGATITMAAGPAVASAETASPPTARAAGQPLTEVSRTSAFPTGVLVFGGSPFTDQFSNPYAGYQVGVGDTGNRDRIQGNRIRGTVVGGGDTAFGPQTAPGGNFLAPIDIQTYPPISPKVHDNAYDGKDTNPPY